MVPTADRRIFALARETFVVEATTVLANHIGEGAVGVASASQGLDVAQILLIVLLAYLAGSIPTSVIIGRLFFKKDLRELGSGNAGGTNAFRVYGWRGGVPTVLVDVGKGVAATLLIARLPAPAGMPRELVQVIAGSAAVVGHIWTVFAGFRGGKGVGTAAGMVASLYPLPLLAAAAIFALVLIIERHCLPRLDGCRSLSSRAPGPGCRRHPGSAADALLVLAAAGRPDLLYPPVQYQSPGGRHREPLPAPDALARLRGPAARPRPAAGAPRRVHGADRALRA